MLSMRILGQFAHGQQAVGGDTFVRHYAEQLAGRQAGIFHEVFKVFGPGKALPRLPRVDGGNGNAQTPGDGLEWNIVLPPPGTKGGCEAGADVAMKHTSIFLAPGFSPGSVAGSLFAHNGF